MLAIFIVQGSGGEQSPGRARDQDPCTNQHDRIDQDDHMDQGERKKDVDGKRKPIPIREVVGEPVPRPAENSDTPGDGPTSHAAVPRSQRERPDGRRAKDTSHKREGSRKQRADRTGSAVPRKEVQRPPLERTTLEDLPFRSFEHDGCEWIVRLRGQASTGSATDSGAPLMHLVFYSAADPHVACGDLLETGRSLDGLSELRLPELLARARLAPSSNDSSR